MNMYRVKFTTPLGGESYEMVIAPNDEQVKRAVHAKYGEGITILEIEWRKSMEEPK